MQMLLLDQIIGEVFVRRNCSSFWKYRWLQPVVIGLATSGAVIVGTLGVYLHMSPATADQIEQPEQSETGETGPPITTSSGEAELVLAAHLKEVGATMYGAWWCPHCHNQKQLFGRQAFAEINYVECDPRGQNPQTELCRAEEIRGYPTWKINGQVLRGTQSLSALADASGYQGPRNFRNLIP
jgi:glutaredoxin